MYTFMYIYHIIMIYDDNDEDDDDESRENVNNLFFCRFCFAIFFLTITSTFGIRRK